MAESKRLTCYLTIALFAIGQSRGESALAAREPLPDGAQKDIAGTTEAELSSVDITTQSTATTTHDRILFTDTPVMDAITIIWYVATFIALISFFLVMACADRRRCRSRKPVDPELTPPPTPAPSYRLFAPPSYDSLEFDKDTDSIFIIPYDNRSVSTDDPQRSAEALASTLEEYIIERSAPPAADPVTGPIVASDITPTVVGGVHDLVEVTSVPVHPTLR
uniref:Secreted protein n=1 Tax=Anopheles marajoara TaxID=58244 RepID=A0A2M4BZB1_9DIPT